MTRSYPAEASSGTAPPLDTYDRITEDDITRVTEDDIIRVTEAA